VKRPSLKHFVETGNLPRYNILVDVDIEAKTIVPGPAPLRQDDTLMKQKMKRTPELLVWMCV
jgi:hypothetical protein